MTCFEDKALKGPRINQENISTGELVRSHSMNVFIRMLNNYESRLVGRMKQAETNTKQDKRE